MSESARPSTPDYAELERLSAVETLKGLQEPSKVRLIELVDYLTERHLWDQFSKITLEDLQAAFGRDESAPRRGRKKARILDDDATPDGGEGPAVAAATDDSASDPILDSVSIDEVARLVIPFLEGNGEVAFDDLAEYTRLDRRALRHHLNTLVRQGRLERVGTGRHAIYGALG